MKNETVVIVVLAVLLALSVAYIIYAEYQKARQAEQVALLQQGAQLGYTQAVADFMTRASSCQPFSVWAGNQSAQVINVACLQAAQPEQAGE